MKGFIKVTKGGSPLLISLQAIALVSPSNDGQTRIQLLAMDKNGYLEKIFIDHDYSEVIELIEAASK
jgi:hypothetical protein